MEEGNGILTRSSWKVARHSGARPRIGFVALSRAGRPETQVERMRRTPPPHHPGEGRDPDTASLSSRVPGRRIAATGAVTADAALSPLDSSAARVASFRHGWGSGLSWDPGVAEGPVAGGAHQLDRADAPRVAPGNRWTWIAAGRKSANDRVSGAAGAIPTIIRRTVGRPPPRSPGIL